jgi:hypothetical protein
MSWLSSAVNWVKDKGSTIAKVALPIAGFAVGLVAPGVGAAIGNIADKIGNKLSDLTGIGDNKPGVFGIGDGLPGIAGIGTGKGKEAEAQRIAGYVTDALEAKKVLVKSLADKVASGQPLTAEEQKAKAQAEADIKKESGVNPAWLIGGLLAFLAFK